MAFEVFDDVAFYWFLQVLIGLFLIPYTLYRVFEYCTRAKVHKTRSHPNVSSIPDYIPIKHLVEDETLVEKTLSLKNIFFMFAWILFFLLLIQLPKWHNKDFISFDPYKILKIAKGASESMIKRAYRKQSLYWHPDKNKDPQAKNNFIMVRKAFEALTDEKTKENYEKYGNPDGYQGTTVTIGLPSALTQKDNELLILTIYFSVLVVLVTIAYYWWNHIRKYHKSGILKESIDIYWRFIKDKMRHKHLLDILSASAEFKILDVKIPDFSDKFKDLLILEEQIKNHFKKQMNRSQNGRNGKQPIFKTLFEAGYVMKASTLIHAHLFGLQIPASLNDEYLFILQECPRLLDVMIDMTLSRERFFNQGLLLIQVKQSIIQGVWPTESPLKQLPEWKPSIDKALTSKGYKSLIKLNRLKNDELKTLLFDTYKKYYNDNSNLFQSELKKSKSGQSSPKSDGNSTPNNEESELLPPGGTITDDEVNQMVKDAECMIRMYPTVKMSYCARTYEEKEVYRDDIVKVTVHIERLKNPWENSLDELTKISVLSPAPEFVRDMSAAERKDYDETEDLTFVDENLDEQRRLQLARLNAPIVHVNKFPFRVREKWMIMVIDKSMPAVVDQRAIPNLDGLCKVDLHFRVQRPAGKYPYVLIAKCDSYLGADKIIDFTLIVNDDKRNIRRGKNGINSNDDEKFDYKIPDKDDGNVSPKWYYLWNETFWEFLLTLFLLYFIYLVLISSSWGKKWIQPYVNMFYDYVVDPILNIINIYGYQFIIQPLSKQILNITGFNFIKYWNGIDDNEYDKYDTYFDDDNDWNNEFYDE